MGSPSRTGFASPVRGRGIKSGPGVEFACASAFTLIEMLVSLGVLTVLVSLSLPAIGKARESARRTECLAHLRSLGQALSMYRGASKDLLPYADRDIDARFGDLDPLRALSIYLDAEPPTAAARGEVRTGPPWECPSDTEVAPARGCSFYYSPIDLMTFFPPAFAQPAVTAYLARDPTVVIFFDNRPRHPGRRDAVPLTGTNVLRLDGGAEAGRAGLSINPRH